LCLWFGPQPKLETAGKRELSTWGALIWLILAILVMLPLKRWIVAHIRGVGMLLSGSSAVATWFYFFLFLPGIFLHELSHWLTATILLVPVSRFAVWPRSKRGGDVQLGAVEIKAVDPLRQSLIGLAPLLGGSLVVWLIARLLKLDELGFALTSGNVEIVFNAIQASLSTADFWLWLYLLFAISNAMLPSPSDRQSWKPVLTFLALIVILFAGLGLAPPIPVGIRRTTVDFITFLAYAFGTAIAVDLFFMSVIAAGEGLIGLLTQRRIKY
jgi:hypothetical protein